jgi:regulator of protease activity HflC (stomatin/prohibitin superfamily)
MVVCIILAILLPILAIAAGAFAGFKFSEDAPVGGTLGIVLCIAMIILFIILPWNFKTVDNGEVAVVKNLGKVEEVRDPGMHTDFWMTKSYVKLDTKRRQVDIVTAAYSNDKQTMDLSMVVQFQIKKDMAKEIVIHYGTLEVLEARIQSVAIERTKAIMSSYTADSLIEQRSVISAAVAEAVEAALSEDYYIDVTNVSLTNIDFSDAYEAAVEQKMIATQEVERAKAEAQKAEETAKGQLKVAEQEAKAQIAKAEAEAKAKELAAQAEANAIAIKSLEVARMLGLTVTADGIEMIKPDLTDVESQLIADYLKYMEYLATWDGKLPNVVADGSAVVVTP